jgi:predicted transcriptional regulator
MANAFISTRVRPELKKALQARADALGLKESDVVRIALSQWLTASSFQSINIAGAGDRSAAQEEHPEC